MVSRWSVVEGLYYGLPPVSVLMHVGLGYWVYTRHWEQDSAWWFLALLAVGGAASLTFWVHMTIPVPSLRGPLMVLTGFLSFTSVALLAVFTGVYTETYFHRRPIWMGASLVLTVGYAGLYVTRPYHDLWFEFGRVATEPVTYYAYEPALGLALIALLAYVVGVYAVYRLVIYLLSTAGRWTPQIGLLIMAITSVIVISALGVANVFPAENMYLDSYSKIPFFLCISLALFEFDLWEVKPVARNTVVETLGDPVVVLDEDDCVVDTNPAAAEVWPAIEEGIGDPFREVCPALAAELTVPSDDETDRQVSLEHGDGMRYYSVTVSAVERGRGRDGEWHSVLLRDVTALERSRSKLQQQNARLDQVASTVSHDLRNPISVFKGRLELLELHAEDLPVDDDALAPLHEDREAMASAADRMVDIIDDILTVAREGETVEETEPVALQGLATEAWGHIDSKDATLSTEGDVTFAADRSKALTVLENLFRNALDHGGEDVTVEVGPTADGFYVADDGPGVPEKHREDLFEFGYTTSDAGTGLGLSIVRTMVEAHGWTVAYDDDYEAGARFVVGSVEHGSDDGPDRAATGT